MTDTNKTLAWCFPFRTAGAHSQEVADPQICYDALAKATGGTYPLGQGGLWHGGVHFDKHTAMLLNQEAVRCIADGEVIAYRIDQVYPTSPKANGEPSAYSTGFVLVKHCLSLPGEPLQRHHLAPSPSPDVLQPVYASAQLGALPARPRQNQARVLDGRAGSQGSGHPARHPVRHQGRGIDRPSRDLQYTQSWGWRRPAASGNLQLRRCAGFCRKKQGLCRRPSRNERSLAGISTIASALVPHTPEINATNPPKMAQRSLRTLPGLILPRVVLDNLPSDHRIRNSFAPPGLKPYTRNWWHLKNRMADASGQRLSGWLGESTLFFDHYSPWDWAGFDCLRRQPAIANNWPATFRP